MRDFERLEELSATVQSGLKANRVIWAIDQALAGADLSEEARATLRSGGALLRSLVSLGESDLPVGGGSPQKMLGGESVPRARTMVVLAVDLGESDEEASATIIQLAETLDAVSQGEPALPRAEVLETALNVFTTISEARLGQATGIVRSRREGAPWLPRTTISSSP